MCQPGIDEINRMGSLDRRVGELFAEADNSSATSKYSGTQIRAIGSHGQTVRHHPESRLHLLCRLATRIPSRFAPGITTVADFRRMDMAAGGQGAPLVPAFHDAVLRDANENRVIVNIGGMANITVLAKNIPVTGFDTGPGNILMDSWIQKKRQLPYDENGSWAASGECNIALLDQLLSHPYIQAPAPKSTGRETFHLAWLESVLTAFTEINSDADIQRTLARIHRAQHCASHQQFASKN
jgi:anhydro-N-acetylmuramic acid kinase